MTLVCTDVEGSTNLWEWDRVAMMAAMATHDVILRAHIADFHGYEVATEVRKTSTHVVHPELVGMCWGMAAAAHMNTSVFICQLVFPAALVRGADGDSGSPETYCMCSAGGCFRACIPHND